MLLHLLSLFHVEQLQSVLELNDCLLIFLENEVNTCLYLMHISKLEYLAIIFLLARQ